jgi:hypothetical protein
MGLEPVMGALLSGTVGTRSMKDAMLDEASWGKAAEEAVQDEAPGDRRHETDVSP